MKQTDAPPTCNRRQLLALAAGAAQPPARSPRGRKPALPRARSKW